MAYATEHVPAVKPTWLLSLAVNMEMETGNLLQKYEAIKAKYKGFPTALKQVQIDALLALMRGKNLVANLPTNFGKSLLFVLPPLLMDEVIIFLANI